MSSKIKISLYNYSSFSFCIYEGVGLGSGCGRVHLSTLRAGFRTPTAARYLLLSMQGVDQEARAVRVRVRVRGGVRLWVRPSASEHSSSRG